MSNNFFHKDSLKVVQISDTHLFAQGANLWGVDTNNTLNKVVETLISTEFHDTDFILLTGDLSQDETPESYKHFITLFQNCSIPVFWIPGNHDDLDIMSTVFTKLPTFSSPEVIELKHWIFIFIDTKLDGAIPGYIKPCTLQTIRNQIEEADKKNKSITLVMHHHPLLVNTPLIDKYPVKNREELWELISDSRVKLIITGHVHNDYSYMHQGVTVECSPATCLQFSKGADSLQIEKAIGYKVHYFDAEHYHAKAVLWNLVD
jgi:Icc protein